MFLYSQIKLFKLFRVNFARRVGKQALASLRLRKCDDVPDIVRAREHHNEPVNAQRDSTVRRRAVFQRLQEKAELPLRLLFRDIQKPEDLFLYRHIMDTNASAADFRTVDDYIVRLRADVARVGIELSHIFRLMAK